jgi:hypothetical protein
MELPQDVRSYYELPGRFVRTLSADVHGFSCLEKTKEVFSMVYPSRR